jgi:hypothetical protein
MWPPLPSAIPRQALVVVLCAAPSQLLVDTLFTLAGRVTDAAGDRIEAQVDYGDGTRVPLQLDPTGLFTLSHAYANVGSFSVRVSARDESSLPPTQTTPFVVRVTSASGPDTDGDGVPDSIDNAILVPNPDQRDTDKDGYGNVVDPDFNNDGIVNFADLTRLKSALFKVDPLTDLDGDGITSFSDLARLKSFFFKKPGPSGLHPTAPGPAPAAFAASAPIAAPIAASARVEASARLGLAVEIGDGARIGAWASIGDDSVVGDGSVVGKRAKLGRRVRLGKNVIVEPGAVIPDDTIVLDGFLVKRAKGGARPS